MVKVMDTVENITKECLSNCEDQVNDLFVTTSSYPNRKTFKDREEFCIIGRKLLLQTCKFPKRLRKTEKMSRIAYIASSGGLLGLCMGFSFVSLAEILYHCFICVSIFFKKSSKSTYMMKDLYGGVKSSRKK